MPASALLTVLGAVSAAPVAPTATTPSLSDGMSLYLQRAYPIEYAGRPPVSGTDLSPFVLPTPGIGKVRFLSLRVMNGSLKVKISSPSGGADQVIPLSDLLLIHVPNSGDELTAIKLVGNADIEFIVAGEP